MQKRVKNHCEVVYKVHWNRVVFKLFCVDSEHCFLSLDFPQGMTYFVIGVLI